jgi:hypothetical protein
VCQRPLLRACSGREWRRQILGRAERRHQILGRAERRHDGERHGHCERYMASMHSARALLDTLEQRERERERDMAGRGTAAAPCEAAWAPLGPLERSGGVVRERGRRVKENPG